MSGDPFDPQGEAREALSTAVSSYGMRVLSDPRILGNLVTDLLPDSPRERSLLVTAAEAGMATELSQHVEQQRLSVETAVALVARGLTERRSIDIAASTWVATEYAQALGYQVRPGIPPAAQLDEDETPLTATVRRPRPSPQAAPFPAAVPPLAPTLGPQLPAPQPAAGPPSPWSPQSSPTPQPTPPSQLTPPSQPAAYQPTSFPPPAGFTSQPSAGQPTSQPPSPYQVPAGQAQFPQPAPPGLPQVPYQPASQPASPYQPAGFPMQPGYSSPVPGSPAPPAWGGAPPGRSRRALLLGIGGGVVVLGAIIGLIVALSSPSPKAPPVTQPSVTHSATHTPKPSASVAATPTIASGVTPLVQLLPSDITDTTTECEPQSLPLPFSAPGLVTATKCADPGLTGSEVFGFQTDSSADYQSTWEKYNKWLGFNPSSAGTACPPAGSQPQGITEWKPKSQSQYQRNQVLECGTLGSGSTSEVVYIWTFPAQDAFIVMQGAHSTTFSQLDTWWKAQA